MLVSFGTVTAEYPPFLTLSRYFELQKFCVKYSEVSQPPEVVYVISKEVITLLFTGFERVGKPKGSAGPVHVRTSNPVHIWKTWLVFATKVAGASTFMSRMKL